MRSAATDLLLLGTCRASLAWLVVAVCVAGAGLLGAGALRGGVAYAEDTAPEAAPEAAPEQAAETPAAVQVSASDEAGEYAHDKVGIEEQLGDTIPEGLMFRDVDGQSVELRSLMGKPTALLLVYLRCPNVCSPLMREVAHTVDELTITAGEDYNLVTVSFDARETPDLARRGKANLLGGMEKKIPPESWRFLTGDGANIRKLCDAVGFYFKRDKQDFLHSSAVIFVSTEGKIVRYLFPGQQRTKENRNETVPAILPDDWKLAVNDARDGNARSFMQRIQKLCYAYDPEGRTYVLNFNRIILIVTLGGVGIFLAFLLIKRNKNPAPASTAQADGNEVEGGGHA